MTKLLVIAEKPSVALDLAKAMGPFDRHDGGDYFETNDYVISFAVGHLVELEQPEAYDKKWRAWTTKSLPILPDEMRRKPRDGKATKRLGVIKKLAKRKDVVGYVNACDAGREGENIFRTVFAWLNHPKPTHRLWLSSLTQGAIRKGFASLRPAEQFDDLGDAASCRAEADWLIGMNATRAVSVRLKSFRYEGVWTAGRVQTPTLTMLVDRELEIYHHRPEPYWLLNASFQAGGQTYSGRYHAPTGPRKEADRILSEADAQAALQRTQDATRWTVVDERTEQTTKPPLLFDLTSLQKTANSALGFSSKRTLDAAQRLYEGHKLISYPRTDSKFLPNDMRARLDPTIEAMTRYQPTARAAAQVFKDGAQNTGRNFNDAKVSDHYAIVPIRMPDAPLSGDDERIFNLIARRFLAAHMPPARWSKVKRTTSAPGVTFITTGRVLEFPGFELANGKVAGDGDPLVALPSGHDDSADLVEATLDEKQTKPKPRLSEAGLLQKMETCGKEIDDDELSEAMTARGLGTPATRAETIEKLISRQYLAREGKSLRATAKAIRLVEVLRAAGAQTLTSVELTGELEHRLKQVENGELARADYMLLMRSQTEQLTNRLCEMSFDDLYPNAQNLGAVPGSDDVAVRETPWGFEADGTDPFFLWKDLRGHVLQASEITEILNDEKHRLGPLTLFPRAGSQGKPYQVMLELERHSDEAYAKLPRRGKREPSRWHLKILNEDGTDQSTATQPDIEETVIRPLCTAKGGQAIQETSIRYADEAALKGERGGLTLPKEVCKRPITAAEAIQFFETGSTDFLEQFISKRGRPFKAKLFLKGNGRHGFEFEPREPKAGAKAKGKGKAGAAKAKAKEAG